MEAHKPDLGIQILGLFNPKQGRKYRTYQFDLLITENEFKHISTKVSKHKNDLKSLVHP